MVNADDILEYLFGLIVLYFGAAAPAFGVVFLLFLFFAVFHFRRLLDVVDKRGRRWFSGRRYFVDNTRKSGSIYSMTPTQLYSFLSDYGAVFRGFGVFCLFTWLTLYLGVSRTLFLYGAGVVASYIYLYFSSSDLFRGYQRLRNARLDALDPKPGSIVFDPYKDQSAYVFQLFDKFPSEKLSGHPYFSCSQKFCFMLNGRNGEYNPALLKDPFFFSKFLYYYTELYIYNSIHDYWDRSASKVDASSVGVTSKLSDILTALFYPSRLLSRKEAASGGCSYVPSYFRSNSLIYSSKIELMHQTIFRVLDDSMVSVRRLRDLSFDIDIDVDVGKSDMAWYKGSGTENFDSFLVGLLTDERRINLLFEHVCLSYFARLDYSAFYSSFQEKLKYIFFQVFPPSYYVRWLGFFLSFNFSRTSFSLFSKGFLLPSDWFGWASLYYFERWAGRTKLGLMASRFATGFDFLNTVHVLKRGRFEFALDATLYPVNRFKKYYYFDGLAQFPLHRSFNFLNRLTGMSLLRPVRLYIDRVRTRKQRRAPLTLWDYDAVPMRETWYAGDGLEPFLDPDRAFFFSDLSFLNDLQFSKCPLSEGFFSAAGRNINRLDNFLKLHPVLNWVQLNLEDILNSKSLKFLLSLNSNSLNLREIFRLNPSLIPYARNIFYRRQSSHFYGWFVNSFSHLSIFPFYDISFRLLLESRDVSEVFHEISRGVESEIKRPEFGAVTSYIFDRFKHNKITDVRFLSPLLKVVDSPKVSFSLLNRRVQPKRLRLVKGGVSRLAFFLDVRLSTWNALKIGFSEFPLFLQRRARSLLRLIFRDPLMFYSPRQRSPKVNFRRFLWSSIFRGPVLAFFSRTPSLERGTKDELFSRYLMDNLSETLADRFGFSCSYTRWLFFNWRHLKKYMFSRYASAGCLKGEYDLWIKIENNPFCIALWVDFFDYLFSDANFFVYSCTVLNGFDNSTQFGSAVPSISDMLQCVALFRNNVVLKLPTNYSNFLLSEEPDMFNRWDWKAFISVGSSWIFNLLSSMYSGSREVEHSLFQSYARVVSFFNRALPGLFPSNETDLLKPGAYRARFGYKTRTVNGISMSYLRNWSWRLSVPAESSFAVINSLFKCYSNTLNSADISTRFDMSKFIAFLTMRWHVREQSRLLLDVSVFKHFDDICFPGESLTRFDFLRLVLLEEPLFGYAAAYFLNEFESLNSTRCFRNCSFDKFYGVLLDLDALLVPALDGFAEDRHFRYGLHEPERPVQAGSKKKYRDYFLQTKTSDGLFLSPSILSANPSVFRDSAYSWGYSLGMPRPEMYNERLSFYGVGERGFAFVSFERVRILVRTIPVSMWNYVIFFMYKRMTNVFSCYIRFAKNFFRGRVDPLQL